ncbi:MAG: MgtC/SapB family protein [Verrucomicrobium sp.]|nr:MgtC/SapB family protein [Verrucomicrobium sp.]
MDWVLAQQLMVSLGLGMLIGLQRERSDSAIGGIRTFPLITLLGTICGQLGHHFGGWIVAVGFISLSVLLFIPNIPRIKSGEASGMTTEVAVLLLYALGAYLVVAPIYLVVAVGGMVALLLHWKQALHRFAGAVGDDDMHAIMRFVLISMVILPILPNQSFGPYAVLNPFEVWLMVVLIVGLGLGGYVAYKILGARAGVLLSGVLGGLVSSTATSVSAARGVRGGTQTPPLASLVIMIASTIAMVRVLVEVCLVAAHQIPALIGPLATMLGAMLAITFVAWAFNRKEKAANVAEQHNPAELKPAFIFALIYAFIKLAVAAANDHLGHSGLYVIGLVSGLADMDAITLSTARLVDGNKLNPDTAWRVILLAAMSNLAFKGVMVGALGGLKVFTHVAVWFGASLMAGGVILWLWP